MNKHLLTLLCLLLITSTLVACLGGYLKYGVLRELGLCQDQSVMAVPFVLLSDDVIQDALQSMARKELEPPTEPPTVPPTEPQITEVPQTETATETATEAPTEPPTEPWPEDVDESWFDDVLFLGDSRTVGLRDYARLGQAEYFCQVGMTVFSATKLKCADKNFAEMTLEDLLSTRSYKKIYVNLGLNECGSKHESIVAKYRQLLELIQEKQPDATVILQGIMTVSRKKAASQWYFGLDNIHALNDAISALADGDRIRYIDVNEWLADEEGYMPSDWSGDGCHPYPSGYKQWANWILDTAGDLHIR